MMSDPRPVPRSRRSERRQGAPAPGAKPRARFPWKTAAVLGAMSLHDLQLAIVMDDVNTLSRAPGIGKKTAQRIALELRDKIRQEDISRVTGGGDSVPMTPGDSVSLALEALISLGYSPQEARAALGKVKGQSDQTEELISLALRAMTQM